VYTTVQKWGNSQAIRIPKAILEEANIGNNDKVKIRVENGNLVIIPVNKHRTLGDRIAEYSGDCQYGEWKTGKPVGKEVW